VEVEMSKLAISRMWNELDVVFQRSLLRDENPEEHSKCESSVMRWQSAREKSAGYKCPECGTGNIDPTTYDCYHLRLYRIKETSPDGRVTTIKVWSKVEGCGHNDNPLLYKREQGKLVDEDGVEVFDPLSVVDYISILHRREQVKHL
jgi:hypothetical protein